MKDDVYERIEKTPQFKQLVARRERFAWLLSAIMLGLYVTFILLIAFAPQLLGTPIIISHKERAKANVVGTMTAIGEVEGRNILIVDDMIDTAGTICMAADMLMSRGAKSVRAAITHPVLSGPAYERINDSALQEVIVTDTIPLNPDKDLHKFTVLSVADMFADVIERVHNYKEISSIFFK